MYAEVPLPDDYAVRQDCGDGLVVCLGEGFEAYPAVLKAGARLDEMGAEPDSRY